MLDEPHARRPGFVADRPVRLSDGRDWWLPLRDRHAPDAEYDRLLQVVYEAEDRPEGLRAELALTIFLLTRNYDLPSDRLDALLSFPPESPALTRLQEAVHDLVVESARRAGQAAAEPHAAEAPHVREVKAPARKAPRLESP